MYRFDKNLNLDHLLDLEVSQICIDLYNVLINFHPDNHINLECRWRIVSASGELVDEGLPSKEKETFKIHKILGKRINRYKVVSEEQLNIYFNNGYILEIFDESDEYESLSISPNIYV